MAGIYGGERQPRNWFIQGRIKNGNKFLNMIHVGDIIVGTIYCMKDFDTLKGTNINFSDGDPKWLGDLFKFFGFPVPDNNEEIPSKKIQNTKLKSILPSGYIFIDLLK